MKKFMLLCVLGASLFAKPKPTLDDAMNVFCGPEMIAALNVQLNKVNESIVDYSKMMDEATTEFGSGNLKRGKGKDFMEIIRAMQSTKTGQVPGIKKHLEICKKYTK